MAARSSAKKIPREEKKEIDWVAKAKVCVDLLYQNGNDPRQTKNGNPDTLVKKLLKPRDISVCGVYKYLSREDQKIIDDKDNKLKRTITVDSISAEQIDFMVRVASTILRFEAKQWDEKEGAKFFVKLTDEGRLILNTIVTKNFSDKKILAKILKKFVPRSIFENQERQKINQC